MKKITWQVQYPFFPRVSRHCKKCGKNTKFSCSEKFRVNAQRRTLDVWLIYHCVDCNTTWNARIYSHISPQSFNPEELEGFQSNSHSLAEAYAMDAGFLSKNGVDEIEVPPYSIMGEEFLPGENVELTIKNKHLFPIKVSALIRKKLHLSQAAYLQMIENGTIKSIPEQDLRKCKLKNTITLIFSK